MQLQEVIDARQSIRKYKEGDIPDEHIAEMVAAAHKTPSHYICFRYSSYLIFSNFSAFLRTV